MTTPPELWLLDTNVWVFGLRSDASFPACEELLGLIGSFSPLIPLQVLKELNAVFSEDELREFYRLINEQIGMLTLDWSQAPKDRVRFFEAFGCKKGDAVIAAHAEHFGASFVVSENRQFLQTVTGLSFEVITPQEALIKLV